MAMTFFERCKRQWRHWRATAAKGRRMFPADALARIGTAIGTGEQHHRGEVRLIVENAMPSDAIWDDVSNRQRASALFAEYGVWDTQDRCGVLIYVNLAERKVDIVADRHIGGKVDSATWQRICDALVHGFARGDVENATLAAIAQVNALLAEHFPLAAPGTPGMPPGARVNELPDQPIVL